MSSAWLAVLVTAPIGVHLGEAIDLPRADAIAVVRTLADAIADHTRRDVHVDDPLWPACDSGGCIDDVRARTRARDVVLVRVIAGLTLIRVIAHRVGAAPVEVDVTHDRLGAECRSLARRLFPEGAPPPVTPPLVAAAVPRPELPSVAPWVVVGGAAVALAVGVGFGASSRSARVDSQDPALSPDDFDRLADRTQSHAIVADVSFVVAAVAAVTAGVLWWTD